MKQKKLLLILFSVFLSPIAQAHGVQGGGFINGLMHPVFGSDHLLAMVSVGILSVQIGGRAIWAVPATFVGVMLLGGILGMMDMPFLGVEMGIALSILALGIAMALDKKMAVIWPMLFVGFFAAFHGYAHGQEMPKVAQAVLYVTGFIIATISLHLTGVLIGEVAKRIENGSALLRYLGAAIAGIGFSILFGLKVLFYDT